LLAVGLQGDGCFYTLIRINESKAELGDIVNVTGARGTVKSICFTADNSHIVLGTSMGEIVVSEFEKSTETVKKFKDGSNGTVGVSCHPISSL
jgi:molybdopterin-binding protein